LVALAVTLAVLAAGRPTDAQPNDPVQRARSHLAANAGDYGLSPDLADLRLSGRTRGLSADHVRFQQTRNGVPVFGAGVSVALPASGSPLVVSRYDASPASPAAPALSPDSALDVATTAAGDVEASPATLVYAASGKMLVPAWQLTLRTAEPRGTWLVLVDAISGAVLYRHNLLRFDSGRVFDPNPAQTNGGTAPAGHCDSAITEGLLAGEYAVKPLQGIASGQDKLKGQWVDLTAPGVPPPGGTGAYKPAGQANVASRNYIYPCNDDRFEEVMVYHHLDRAQRKFQALGFTGASGVVERPVSAHAHYMPDCNAFFDPTNRALHFGDFDGNTFFPSGCGGSPPLTDSAEDADWIIHEYGHAVLDDQVPGFAFGPYPLSEQALSIGEGFSDFLAAALNQDPCWGEYVSFGVSACDGGSAPGLRTLQNSLAYPAGFEACPDIDANGDTVPESEEPHCGGEVWGGALWDLAEAIAGGPPGPQALTVALTLVLDSQFYLDQRATFDEAAAAICLADDILYNGGHASQIAAAFSGRGISGGACASSDFPSFFMRILHTYSGDLEINLRVGLGVDQGAAPVCSFTVPGLDPDNGTANFHVRYILIINDAVCLGNLPPTVAQPWWLEVRDTAQLDEGSIADFEVLLPGGARCIAAPLPVVIPDALDLDDGPYVYAKIDCSVKVTPPSSTPTPTPSPTPVPGPNSFGNVDCSPAINSVDALKLLRYSAGLSVIQTEPPPCPDIGVDTVQAGELQGDVNCSNAVNSVDALLLLRWSAALSVSQNEPCPDIGS